MMVWDARFIVASVVNRPCCRKGMTGNESEWLTVHDRCPLQDWAPSAEGKQVRIPSEIQIKVKMFHL